MAPYVAHNNRQNGVNCSGQGCEERPHGLSDKEHGAKPAVAEVKHNI
jgi:hypothetical protein